MMLSLRTLAVPALALALGTTAIAPPSAQAGSDKLSAIRSATSAAAAAVSSTSSDNTMLTKIAVADVTAVLDSADLSYEVSTDDAGDPMVTVVDSTIPEDGHVTVFFYDCGSDGCEDIGLYTYYSLSSPEALDKVNGFNQDLRWGRAYLDSDNDPVFETDINATGGIGREALGILMRTYFSSLKDFETALNIQ